MSELINADNYLQRLFIDEVKGALGHCGSSGGGGEVSDDMIATDDEVNDVLDDVFNSDVATDEEVSDVLDEVFG